MKFCNKQLLKSKVLKKNTVHKSMKIDPKITTSNNTVNQNTEPQTANQQISIFYDKNNNGVVDEEDFSNKSAAEFVKSQGYIGAKWSIQIKRVFESFAQKGELENFDENIVKETSGLDYTGECVEHKYYNDKNQLLKIERYEWESELQTSVNNYYDSAGDLVRAETEGYTDFKFKDVETTEYDSQHRPILCKNSCYIFEMKYSEDGKTKTTTVKTLDNEPLYMTKDTYNDDGTINKNESGCYSMDGKKIKVSDVIGIEYEYNVKLLNIEPGGDEDEIK